MQPRNILGSLFFGCVWHHSSTFKQDAMHATSAVQDNYVWVLHESGSGKTAVVDPSEAAPVIAALDQR